MLSKIWQYMLSSMINTSCIESTSHEGKQNGQHTCSQSKMMYWHYNILPFSWHFILSNALRSPTQTGTALLASAIYWQTYINTKYMHVHSVCCSSQKN